MSQFEASPKQMGRLSDEIEQVSSRILSIAQDVQGVGGNLRGQSQALSMVASSLTGLAGELKSRSVSAQHLASGLQSAANLYQQAENRILSLRGVPVNIIDQITSGRGKIQGLLDKWGIVPGGSGSDTSAYDGDPVDMTSGNYVDDVTELLIHGPGDLRVVRHYNSRYLEAGAMGIGWSHNYETHLEIFPEYICLVWGDQTQEKFSLNNDGLFQKESGDAGTIRMGEDAYLYESRKHHCWEFDVSGRLVRIQNGAENTITELHYDNDQLVEVQDVYGNKLTYLYGENGLLAGVSDHCGRTVSFHYEQMFLTEAVAVDVLRSEYRYDENGRLFQIIGPDGTIRLTNRYDEENRVIQQNLPDGTSARFSYSDNAVTLVDRNGARTVYYHDEKGRISETVYEAGKEIFYYNDHNQRIGYTDLNGNKYTRKYDSNGNVIEYTDALEHTQYFEYDEAGNRIRTVLPTGGVVNAEYDEYGNMIALTDSLGVKTTFDYEQGLLKSVHYADDSCIRYIYDKKGLVCSSVDENGSTTEYTFDDLGRCICRMAGTGARTVYEYDAADRILSITNPLGQIRSYRYEYGRLASVVDFDGLEEHWVYNAMGLVIEYVDKGGRHTAYEYDEMSNVSGLRYPDGNIVTRKYDAMNRLEQIHGKEGSYLSYTYDPNGNCICRDENGHVEKYQYDALNRVIEVSEGNGGRRRYTYDAAGRIRHMYREDGAEFDYQYDMDGRLIRQELPENRVCTLEYDLRGRIIRRDEKNAGSVCYTYYPNGLVRSVKWADGNYIENEYDHADQLIRETRADGYALCYEYDLLGRKVSTTDNENRRRRWEYDASGNVISDTDARGSQTRYTYTPSGKLDCVRDALGNRVYFKYDEMDRLTGLLNSNLDRDEALRILQKPEDFQNPDNNSYRLTTWERDGEGRIVSRVDALGNRRRWTYRADGQLLQKEDAQKRRTLYEYDDNARLRRVIFPDQREAHYEYNALGWITGIRDWTGELNMAYDPYGRLSSSVDARNQAFRYMRDEAGRPNCMVYPDGMELHTRYDEKGLPLELTADGFRTSYDYDSSARISSRDILLDGGFEQPARKLHESYSYTSFGRIKQLKQEEKEVLSFVTFAYDDAGNMIQRSQINVPGAEEEQLLYEYDPLNRLQRVVRKSKDGNEALVEAYTYDAFGNCTLKETGISQTEMRYNVLDQLVWKCTDGKEETRYYYDPDGRLIRTEGAENTAREYDALGNLIQITDNEKKLNLEVNSLGTILSQTDQDGKRTLFWTDYGKRTGDILGTNNGTGWSCLVRDGKLLGCIEQGEWAAYLCDERGSVLKKLERGRDWTDPKDRMQYDSFGDPLDAAAENSGIPKVQFGYTGLYYNPVGRTWRTATREYDAGNGRFLSRDQDRFMRINRPQTLNQYQYCYSNPLVWVDPDGMDCYIFYLPEWKNEATNDQKQLAKLYGYDKSQVHLIPITDDQSFTDGWNAMGTENGHSVDIDTVLINTHANPSVLGDGDANNFTLTTADVANLQDKEMDNMILLGCNAGHKDYADTNIANAFASKTDGAPVLASDGTVYSGLTFFNQTKRSYSSRNDKYFRGYRKGKRDNDGWIVYQEENGRVNTTDVGDKKMNVTEMTKELRKYPKTPAVCSSGGHSGGGHSGGGGRAG